MPLNTSIRASNILWLIVSKAVFRSSMTTSTHWLSSIAQRRSLLIFRSAVSVLRPLRYADWLGCRGGVIHVLLQLLYYSQLDELSRKCEIADRPVDWRNIFAQFIIEGSSLVTLRLSVGGKLRSVMLKSLQVSCSYCPDNWTVSKL